MCTRCDRVSQEQTRISYSLETRALSSCARVLLIQSTSGRNQVTIQAAINSSFSRLANFHVGILTFFFLMLSFCLFPSFLCISLSLYLCLSVSVCLCLSVSLCLYVVTFKSSSSSLLLPYPKSNLIGTICTPIQKTPTNRSGIDGNLPRMTSPFRTSNIVKAKGRSIGRYKKKLS